MSLSNNFETAFLGLIFNGTPISLLAQNQVTDPATNLYISLHINDPSESGTQETSEVAYDAYARVPVVRTTDGWIVDGSTVRPVNNITFSTVTTGNLGTVTHVGIGTEATGDGRLIASGALTPQIVLAPDVIPTIGASSLLSID